MRVFLLPQTENTTLTNVYTTDLYPKPLNTVGYNYFQVQTNDSIFKLLLAPENEGKTFYYIMENLTMDINYENNIKNISEKYFGESVDTNFLQLWEIVLKFNLITNKVSVDSSSELISVFNKLKKYSKIDIKSSAKKTHLCLMNSIQFDTHELDVCKKITKYLGELDNLEKGGFLLIKVKELIHAPSAHLLYLLSTIFEDVYIYRPELSYVSRGERYIVCKNYLATKLKYDLSKDYISLNINLPTEYVFTLNVINRVLMQEEYIVRNKMRNFINSQNYFGDEYHSQLAIQQISTDKWISTNFMITSKDYTELIKEKEKELNTNIVEFESLIDEKTKLVL